MGADGLYGVPLEVAATYIILFTHLRRGPRAVGRGEFFVDMSLAAFRGARVRRPAVR